MIIITQQKKKVKSTRAPEVDLALIEALLKVLDLAWRLSPQWRGELEEVAFPIVARQVDLELELNQRGDHYEASN